MLQGMVLTVDSFGTAKNRTFFGCYAEENINPRCLCGSTEYFTVAMVMTYFTVVMVMTFVCDLDLNCR